MKVKNMQIIAELVLDILIIVIASQTTWWALLLLFASDYGRKWNRNKEKLDN